MNTTQSAYQSEEDQAIEEMDSADIWFLANVNGLLGPKASAFAQKVPSLIRWSYWMDAFDYTRGVEN